MQCIGVILNLKHCSLSSNFVVMTLVSIVSKQQSYLQVDAIN